jgi:hypothetical protein
MSQKVLSLAIVAWDLAKADEELDFMHATGAQSLPGTPSLPFLELIVSIGKAKYTQQLRELSPDELLELAQYIQLLPFLSPADLLELKALI